MHTLAEAYSGVVVNQNQIPTGSVATDSTWRYQDFFLPEDYVRGSGTEAITPPLTGFQILTTISDVLAQIEWAVEYQVTGLNWVTLASGSTQGADAVGSQVWFDVTFDRPVDIPVDAVPYRFRIAIRADYGVDAFWLANPNPQFLSLTSSKAYVISGVSHSPIQVSGSDASFGFRILALVGDEGVDFLGNNYRSAVAVNGVSNTNTLDTSAQNKIWMSKPNPSRFAVENLYFDARKRTGSGYSHKNYVLNPSFEAGLGSWGIINGSGATGTFTQINTWSSSGSYAAQIAGTSLPSGVNGYYGFISKTGVSGYRIDPTLTYSASAIVNIVTLPSSHNVQITILWYDAAGTFLSQNSGASTSTGQVSASAIPPTNAIYAAVAVDIVNGSGSTSTTSVIYVDSVQLTQTAAPITYFDGSHRGCTWAGQPNNSASLQIVDPTIDDTPVVIDSVLVDPVTPGIYFNIYYSNEGDAVTVESDWDNKLWRRVPFTFQAVKRESHKFPAPIQAKFIKVEFTHLQAQHYSAGPSAAPIKYKKHPKWVLDYFLIRLNQKNSVESALSGKAGVIFDAYDLAYNYYLDDLHQEPDQPIEISDQDVVSRFIQSRDDLSDRMDPIMSNKISQILEPFAEHPTALGDNGTLLNSIATGLKDASLITDYPVERTTSGLFPDVLETKNAQTIYENNYPVMFFYLTCRHKYREIQSTFSHDRAYFAGIREIAFLRDNYKVEEDTAQYIEIGADFFNTAVNDFVNDNGVLMVSQ